MNKLIITLFVSLILLAGCNSKCIEDSGNHVEKNTVVKAFDKIDISGAFKVVLRQDSSYALKIGTDSNLMSAIKIDVSSSELRIKMEEGSYCGSDSIVIQVGIGELKRLKTSGAVSMRTDGHIYANDVELNFSGSSDINLVINAGKLNTSMDGAGKLALTGQAGVHQLSTQGTVTIDAFGFIAGIYNLDITGSAKANINVLNELNVKTEGSSEVYYKGNPKSVKEKKSGAAKLEKVN
ncbi:MAG: DUF2807 domain-containing protein [Pedobacter sp.]|nr:MAG: DUF2807 domain-containing protein [Pedobacter sp.]